MHLLMCVVVQSCLTLCNPMDYNPQGSSVHRIFQARILEWAAIPFSRGWRIPAIPGQDGIPDPGIQPRFPALQADSL